MVKGIFIFEQPYQVIKHLNSTKLVLIQKKSARSQNKLQAYLISLYNLSYKVVSKIIAQRLKPILNRVVVVPMLFYCGKVR